jgi:hypothetical protein
VSIAAVSIRLKGENGRSTMKFICLKYRDGHTLSAWQQESLLYDEKLRELGHLFASESIHCTGEGIDLCSVQGQIVVTDDQSESHKKQYLDGLMFLEARDLNHAIILISNHPGMKTGWFKIHPADDKGGKP